MVSKKHIKWSLLLPWVMLIPAILAVILYLIIPTLLAGTADDPNVCEYPGDAAPSSGESSIKYAMADLCTTSQTFLSVIIMMLVVLGGVATLVPVVLVSIDILQSEGMEGPSKAIWLIAIWFVPGYLATVAYYFMVKKKQSDPVE
jgi:hypothetical protein